MTGREIYLKLENLQLTGSFKLRGALNKLKLLASAPAPPRLLAVSAGNHGRAIAYGAKLLGLVATVVVPRSAPPIKIEAIRQTGVECRVVGENYDEAERVARQWAADERMTFVSPYNDRDVIAGQGTVALEVVEQVPDLDAILVPVGGGGLLAGVALMAKALNPRVKVVGVQPEHTPAMYESFRLGHLLRVQERPTLADGLAGNIEEGSVTFPLVRQYVDEMMLVSEESLSQAIIQLLAREQVIVEGAGAVTVAALLSQPLAFRATTIATILTGRNIDVSVLRSLIHSDDEGGRRVYDQAGSAQTW